MPDLRVLVQLGLSAFAPTVDLDGPMACVAHREGSGAWGWVVTLASRGAGEGPATPDGMLGWSVRPWRGETLQVAHLRPDLLVFTDDPDWVVAHREWLQTSRPPEPGADDAVLRVMPEVFTAPPAPPAPPASLSSTTPDASPPEPGEAAAAWLSQTAVYEVRIDFRPRSVELELAMQPRPGSALAAVLSTVPGLEAGLLERIPATAPLIVAGDARALPGAPLGPLLGSAPLLSLIDALAEDDGPAEPGTLDVGDALGPLLSRVERDFVWTLQASPGAKRASLFLAARLPPAPGGSPAPPSVSSPGHVAYRLDAGDVHRLEGTARFLPADFLQTGEWLLAAGGEAPRALLDGLLSGRLAGGLGANPELARLLSGAGPERGLVDGRVTGTKTRPVVIMLLAADVEGLVHLLAPGRLAPTSVRAAPLTWRLQTDGEALGGRLSVPFEQVDRLAPLLRRRIVRPAQESTDWLFPEGI